jgi:predicted O-methyltransferase YrrM
MSLSSLTSQHRPSRSNVHRTLQVGDAQHRFPPRELLTPADIAAHAARFETRQRLIAALELLDHDEVDRARLAKYVADVSDASEALPIDCATIAHAAADLLHPRRAIEIGVRRGFCAAAVASAAEEVELHLMDRWRPTDRDNHNHGPVLVRRQLAAIGHRGNVHFHQGDSHVLLPHLCLPHHHAPLRFDLAIVDGDRTEAGADQDLRDIFPSVAGGGVVVFDGLNDPAHPQLSSVWHRWGSRLDGAFAFAEYLHDGAGVGVAMRLAG